MKTPTRTALTEEEIRAFEPDAKVGLLATVSPQGLPHLTLITSLMARDPTTLVWGQFCEGKSKDHVRRNPNAAFLVMTLEREIWRGTARWTHAEQEGEAYDLFNAKPMFRYNSYFGIHTVHHMNLLSVSPRESLNLPGVVGGTLLARAAGVLLGLQGRKEILNPWSRSLLGALDTVKFLAWVARDGFPRILPVVPAQPAGGPRLALVPSVYREELSSIPAGATVSLLAMNLQMESVLVRGTFSGFPGPLDLLPASIELDWVYNSMPPKQGQIYPPLPLEPRTDFS